jgi:hypothetical protein
VQKFTMVFRIRKIFHSISVNGQSHWTRMIDDDHIDVVTLAKFIVGDYEKAMECNA